MKAVIVFAVTVFLASFSFSAFAAPPELSNGATVRIKISELDEVWQVGTVEISNEGCAVVWIPPTKVSGGRRGYGLLFLDKLEQQQDEVWIDVPVEPFIATEPQPCQEGAD